MGEHTLYVVSLDCSHIIKFRCGRDATPKRGEQILCLRCDAYRMVVESPNEKVTQEYRLRCQDCIFSRRYGINKDAAIIAASNHVRRKRHDVDFFLGEDFITTYRLKNRAQLVLL